MKRIYNKDQRLESQRWFPYIAWVAVIIFAIFVYQLTKSVNTKTHALQEEKKAEDAKYQIPIEELRKLNKASQ